MIWLVLSFLVIFSPSVVLAKTSTPSASVQPEPAVVYIGQSQIAPNSPVYFLKTLRERLEFSFARTNRSKTFRKVEFSTRRLRETKTLIADGRQDLIPPVLENYKFEVDEAIKSASEKDLLNLKEEYSRHLTVLEAIFASLGDQRAKRSTRATVERLLQRDMLSTEARTRACSFLEKEASSSGINSTEKEFIKQQVELCKVRPL